MRYRFLEFELDTDQQALFRQGAAVALRRQSYRVLLHLLQRAPAVVGKDELLDAIWGHQAISSSAVAQTVRELRDALDDDADAPRAILTKHRVGYQFIAAIASDEIDAADPEGRGASSPVERVALGAGDGTQPGAAQHDSRANGLSGAGPRNRFDFMAERAGRRWPIVVAAAIGCLALLWWWGDGADRQSERGWPTEPAAAEATRQALLALRAYRVDDAMAALARARVRADTPRLALTLARLHLEAGESPQAQHLLAQLEARRAQLARPDVVQLEALKHELAGRHALALERYRVLNELVPDDLDHALTLFEVEVLEHDRERKATYQRISGHDGLPAGRRLLLSAQAAGRDQNNRERITQADAVLAIEPSGSNLAALARVERGTALRHLGQLDEARDELQAAARSLESGGLVRQAAETWLNLFDLALAQGDLDTTAEGLDALHRRLDGIGDGYLEGRVLHARGRIARRRGHDEQALALFSAAVDRHEVAGNGGGVASALSAQSGPLRRLGRPDQARAALERALVLAEQSEPGSIAAGVHVNLGNLHAAEGRHELAEQHLQQALRLFRRTRDPHQEALALENLADLSRLRGDLRAATDRQEQALARYRDLDLAPDIARSLVSLARTALPKGDLEVARELAGEGVQLQRRLAQPVRLAHSLSVLADIDLRAADLGAARSRIEEARAMAPDDATLAAVLSTLDGRMAELADHPEAAREHFQRALDLRAGMGQRGSILDSRLDLARIDLASGRFASAEQAALLVAGEAVAEGAMAHEREARLVLADAMQRMARLDDMERELVAVRALLDQTPDFDAEMRWTVLRARLDLDDADARERLAWVHGQAASRSQRLIALRAQAELDALGGLSPDDSRAWREDAAQRGLRLLLRPQVRIRR